MDYTVFPCIYMIVQTTYNVVFFAARGIAGYLQQYDQQIKNCD